MRTHFQTSIQFRVIGDPAPQGSKRLVRGNRMIEVSKKVGPWREAVQRAARAVFKDALGRSIEPQECPIALDVLFLFPRPRSVSVKRRPHHIVRPDLSKLLRSTEDAMTGVIYNDDAQIVQAMINKEYSDDGKSGAIITVLFFPETDQEQGKGR